MANIPKINKDKRAEISLIVRFEHAFLKLPIKLNLEE